MGEHTTARARFILAALACLLAIAVFASATEADSIWNRASTQPASLYSTTKGEYKIGDLITIVVVDNFTATNSASTNTDKETDKQFGFEGFDDLIGINHLFGRPISADPQFTVNAESEFDGEGTSRRSSRVTGTVSGQITEILDNGNLRIEASQKTLINGEKNSVILVGTVRPQDISAQNTVFSTQIANAEIHYDGKGPLSNVEKRGVITEFFEFIWPF
jgi:flagellar L-ring protein precursor FlgH